MANRKTIKFSIPEVREIAETEEGEAIKQAESGIELHKSKIKVSFAEKNFDHQIQLLPQLSFTNRDEFDVSPSPSQTRMTQMFRNIGLRRSRPSVYIRPPERYLPTYQLDSFRPLNTLYVKDIAEKLVIAEMEKHRTLPFNNDKAMNAIARSLSEEILNHIRAKDYNRYKIFVALTIAEKRHQAFHHNVAVLWDIEKDSMANCVYDRGDRFVLVNVYSLYYD